MRFHIVGDSATVICNTDHGVFSLLFCTYADLRALFGIFQSVVDKIDDDLYDKLCVHACKDQIVTLHRYRVPDRLLLQM